MPEKRPCQPPRKSSGLPPLVAVRCLGPGAEHTFRTRDPAHNRRCPRCERVVREMSMRELGGMSVPAPPDE